MRNKQKKCMSSIAAGLGILLFGSFPEGNDTYPLVHPNRFSFQKKIPSSSTTQVPPYDHDLSSDSIYSTESDTSNEGFWLDTVAWIIGALFLLGFFYYLYRQRRRRVNGNEGCGGGDGDGVTSCYRFPPSVHASKGDGDSAKIISSVNLSS